MPDTPEPGTPQSDAAEAGLVHVSDADPGIARRRVGKGFGYRLPDGRALRRALPDFAATTGTFKLGELSCCNEDERAQVAMNSLQPAKKD